MKRLIIIAAFWFATSVGYAEIIARKFAPASTKQDIYNLQNIFIDIANTNWIAWNTSPTLTGGLLGPGSLKPEMYTTVVNPSIQVDAHTFSDKGGRPRAVLYGDAATTPDVVRVEGETTVTYDEGGAFNNFNQSGIYEFEFFVREAGEPVFHGDLWLLIDVDSDPPLPVLHYWGEEQVVGGDFTDINIGDFTFPTYGKWDGTADVVDGAAQFTEDGSLFQFVNVRHLRAQIQAGYVTAVGTVGTYAHSGNLTRTQDVATALAGSTGSPFKLPVGTEYVQVRATGLAGERVDDVSLKLYLDGDYNNDGSWTAGDLDVLTSGIRAGETNWRLDVNGDGSVNLEDRRLWIETLAQTFFGDANFDRRFNSTDLLLAFQSGEYEDFVEGNSTWVEGDFTGDGEFDSLDLLRSFQTAVYEQDGVEFAQSVPEPSGVILLVVALTVLARRE